MSSIHSTSKDVCPECGAPVKEKKGKFGWFIGCTRYPKCNWTTSIEYWESCGKNPAGYHDNKLWMRWYFTPVIPTIEERDKDVYKG